ncbi:hypothetical protein FRC07_006764, partial [Ceratobasidium sp. 392]
MLLDCSPDNALSHKRPQIPHPGSVVQWNSTSDRSMPAPPKWLKGSINTSHKRKTFEDDVIDIESSEDDVIEIESSDDDINGIESSGDEDHMNACSRITPLHTAPIVSHSTIGPFLPSTHRSTPRPRLAKILQTNQSTSKHSLEERRTVLSTTQQAGHRHKYSNQEEPLMVTHQRGYTDVKQRAPERADSDPLDGEDSDVEILEANSVGYDIVRPQFATSAKRHASFDRVHDIGTSSNIPAALKATNRAAKIYPPDADSNPSNKLRGQSTTDSFSHNRKLLQFMEDATRNCKPISSMKEALGSLRLRSAAEHLPGLRVTLMPHQLIGVSWMVQQELGQVRGGILANPSDEMGLGKTVQTIGLLLVNQPSVRAQRSSTLIIAPAALLYQWYQEIIDRVEPKKFKVWIHHAQNKLKNVQDVKQYDIIITTFHTLTKEFSEYVPDEGKHNNQGDAMLEVNSSSSEYDEAQEDVPRKRGPLTGTKWYRVVADEAQNIRNRHALSQLDATYRWALTGTPVTNALSDLYGIIRYLHFSPFDNWKNFKHFITGIQRDDPQLAGRRAQALLKLCLLRRTKTSRLDNKPLILLGSKAVELEWLTFSADEREIYDSVEARQQQQFNKFLKAGTVMKNYSAVLVMLLRLRQVCDHPQLIASATTHKCEDTDEDANAPVHGKASTNGGTSATATSATVAKCILGDDKFSQILNQLRELAVVKSVSGSSGNNMPISNSTECEICLLRAYLGLITKTSRVELCILAYQDNRRITLFTSSRHEAQDGFGNITAPCPHCGTTITKSDVFAQSAFDISESELENAEKIAMYRRTGRHEILSSSRNFNDHRLAHADTVSETDRKIQDDPVPELNDVDEGEEQDEIGREDGSVVMDRLPIQADRLVVPSAKMTRVMQLLNHWREEAPDDKVILYSQWTSMLDLMLGLLQQHKIQALRFDGGMSQRQRNDTLYRFRRPDGPAVLLISLKCGGVGLNLIAANRVICIDPAWNAATEQQAFDRVHRI